MSSGIFRVIAQFQDTSGSALRGSRYKVRLYDQDPLFDGYLGESDLDEDGTARVMVFVSDIKSVDSPGERKPDLYFILERDGEPIFYSETLEDVDFEEVDPVTGQPKSLTRHFGPFRVDTQ